MTDKGKIMAAYLGVGTHMWGEYDTLPDTLDFDEPTWEAVTARLARAGGNMIVLDVGEGVVLPGVPELAVKGAWTAERVAAEKNRLAAMGIELIPKLNFSTTHDAWLGPYSRMVSTPEYYRVCETAIRDVIELFGHPRFIHLGFDEEGETMQRRRRLVRYRQGDLWWHDLDFLAGVASKAGSRPWIWSDYAWHHKDEFLKRMSKDIVQSNWYYSDFFDMTGEHAGDDGAHARIVDCFVDFDKAGFDQIPCGSIWERYDNFALLVDFCDRNLSRERNLGYLMAAWYHVRRDELWKHLFAFDIVEEIIKDKPL